MKDLIRGIKAVKQNKTITIYEDIASLANVYASNGTIIYIKELSNFFEYYHKNDSTVNGETVLTAYGATDAKWIAVAGKSFANPMFIYVNGATQSSFNIESIYGQTYVIDMGTAQTEAHLPSPSINTYGKEVNFVVVASDGYEFYAYNHLGADVLFLASQGQSAKLQGDSNTPYWNTIYTISNGVIEYNYLSTALNFTSRGSENRYFSTVTGNSVFDSNQNQQTNTAICVNSSNISITLGIGCGSGRIIRFIKEGNNSATVTITCSYGTINYRTSITLRNKGDYVVLMGRNTASYIWDVLASNIPELESEGTYGNVGVTLGTQTNISSISSSALNYIRHGNIVSGTFQAAIATTLAGTASFEVILPIASNFTIVYDAIGTGSEFLTQRLGRVTAVSANDRLLFEINSADTNVRTWQFNFQYVVK